MTDGGLFRVALFLTKCLVIKFVIEGRVSNARWLGKQQYDVPNRSEVGTARNSENEAK